MNKINYGILIIILLICTIDSNAQINDSQPTTSITTEVSSPDSVKSILADPFPDDNLDNVLSDKLDSMVNTWYVQNAYPVDSIEKACSYVEQNEIPDSVYISRLQNLDSYVPLPFNESVKKFINFYVNKRRGQVSIMMGLSNYYFPLFEEALAKYNLPAELKYLPIIESALNPRIVSRAGASGLWQFMYGTAKMYGLEINSYIDERNDPIKSTDAAARYLRDLYAIYGDWHIVIAAYNCGPGNVNKAVRRSGGKQGYWEIYSKLPRETRGYIPIFIAATYVMNHAKEHNLVAIQPSFKMLTDTIIVNSYVNFEQIAANLDISVLEIRQLNPQYKRDIIPAKADKPYVLKLPLDKISPFIDNETQIFAYNRDKYFPNNQIALIKEVYGKSNYNTEGKKKIVYTVRSGDSPGEIAERFRISTSNLVEWNNIRHSMIRTGQRLTIYVNGNTPETLAKAEHAKVKPEVSKVQPHSENIPQQLRSIGAESALSGEYTVYTVRSGDSLYTIAKQFAGVSDLEIKLLNKIKNARSIVPGQKLKIPVKA
ncbi:MAG TPA: transglycosylase SLT domain-containing protein [Prolixibacteraceae bacterium]|nr:transglycosylase SLT domain-containing protein [Prolixibacteraceae bacterium]